MDTPAVDVLVIGGGVQGLVILDRLLAAGYSCALVTEGDLGAGQTLHSHGFLNTGFGLSGSSLPQAAAQLVHPFLRARGVTLTGNWAVLPPPGLRGLLLRARPAFARLPPAHLPEGFSPASRVGIRSRLSCYGPRAAQRSSYAPRRSWWPPAVGASSC